MFEYPAGKGPKPRHKILLRQAGQRLRQGQRVPRAQAGRKTIAGRAGFEAIADDSKGKLSHLIDVVPAGDRIYMLVSAGPHSHATSGDAERFRDSFRLIDGEPEPGSTSTTSTPDTPLPALLQVRTAWRRVTSLRSAAKA